MTENVVAVAYDRWTRTREIPTSFRNPVRLWMKAVWYKANPRPQDYMKVLLVERYPEAIVIDAAAGPFASGVLEGASKIVLLYPDAIGLGFSRVERAVRRRAPGTALEVLNGRRRQFAFDVKARRALRIRRFLEWTMLIECAASLVVIVATPFLLIADLVRGRT